MWLSFFMAALRNLGRNRLHGALTIGSLGLALAVVILVGLVVRNEQQFDRFMPDMDRTYMFTLSGTLPGGVPFTTDKIPYEAKAWLSTELPEVSAVARMAYGQAYIASVDGRPVSIARFSVEEGSVRMAFVDPAFFEALPLPAVNGIVSAAAQAPDTVIITETIARRYFHTSNPIGRRMSLVFSGNVLQPVTARVGAVLRDLPPESHLSTQVFLSGPLAARLLGDFAASNPCKGCIGTGITTYVRLMPDVRPAVVATRLRAQVSRLAQDMPDLVSALNSGNARFELVPVSSLHTRTDIPQQTYTVPMGIFVAVSGFAGLVLIMAAGNFTLLMISRGKARGIEIGVRTALGARRRDLVLQLVAEATVYALSGVVLGMALVEQALPVLNHAISRTIAVDGWRDSAVIFGLFGLLCAVGIGAGLVPALALATRPPSRMLSDPLAGAAHAADGRDYGRSGLVALQFAVLASLLLVTIVFYRQIALEGTSLALEAGNVLVVNAPPDIQAEIRALSGVVATGRSEAGAVFGGPPNINMETSGGVRTGVSFNPVDSGFFALYGIRPLAGSLTGPAPSGDLPGRVVLNRAAVRALRFASPEAAIGQRVRVTGRNNVIMEEDIVAGVVPDMALNAARAPPPSVYQMARTPPEFLSVKMRPAAAPDVERAITALWNTRVSEPMRGFTLDDWRRAETAPIRSLARMLAFITAAGGVIASVGLFQLSTHSVRRRAREIALRQAFGARPWEAVRLMIRDQTPPILLAIVVAWPIASLLTAPWLRGFANHVEVGPVTVAAAGLSILGIAWLTTGMQALWIGFAKPGPILRYE